MAAPKAITKTVFICATRIGTEYHYTLMFIDPTKGANSSGYVVLGTEEITLAVPDVDPQTLHIAALEAKRKAIMDSAVVQADKVQLSIDNVLAGKIDYFVGF
jgi:hypothetical protein